MKSKKLFDLIFNNLIAIFITFSLFINNIECQKVVSQYLLQDQYFDRIFIIEETTNAKEKYYLQLYCKEKNMLSISISQTLPMEEHPRFPIYPEWKESPPMQNKGYTFFGACNNLAYEVNTKKIIKNKQSNFLIKITRKRTGVEIFTLKDFNYRTKDHIIIETIDPSTKWGLGERFQKNFHVADGLWTVWNRDRPWEIDHGSKDKSGQTYGHQPVYLAKQSNENGKFHLVYFKNTYGFNFESSQQSRKITYTVTGGNIHFIIIAGQQPQSVLKQYHSYIGGGHIPPFWSLGYHQSRWGYKSIQDVEEMVKQFQVKQMPLETVWSDLDYMDQKAIFTVDRVKYPPQRLNKLLKQKNLHYIPLIDVGVFVNDNIAINKGRQMNVFIKTSKPQSGSRIPSKNVHSSSTGDYIGTVWPGKVHYVDYLHPNASEYWQSQLQRLYSQIPFSGIWLDMNEPSNFQGNQFAVQSYKIQHTETINMMTININLDHYCSASTSQTFKHTEVHAYYGHLSTVPTHNFLKKYGRPFIISRSNSVGSGTYAGHWTGDNVATWDFLRLSISGNFLFQIFGIQMVGADICGFRGNTNEQLCSRWMQVGSMYPFARNHNENESISQEPYRFGPTLMQTSQLSFLQRYSLLKQMYTTMISLNGTGSFYRPIIFEFPEDNLAYNKKYVETEFLIGDYLLGAPIVEQSANQRDVYFPGDNNQIWYQLKFDKSRGFGSFKYYHGQSTGIIQNKLPSAPPIFLRGGRLIFVNKPTTRTEDLDSNFTVYVGLDKNQYARGSFLQTSDFNNQQHIHGCINLGCQLHFIVTQVQSQEATSIFTLNWNKSGNYLIKNRQQKKINISRIVLFNKDKVLSSKQDMNIVINNQSGSIEFSVQE